MAGDPLVLLTRPAGRSDTLATLLGQADCRVAHIPCLAIEAFEFDHQPDVVARLDTFTQVVFVSPAAAEWGVRLMQTYWPQWPIGLDWIATGRATAAILSESLLPDVLVPAGEDGEHSEGLLELPQFAAPAGSRVLICKGEGGRPLLAEELRRRGAEVEELALYRRVLPRVRAVELQRLIETDLPDLVVALSGETITNLQELAGGLASRLRKVPICVPSRRLQQLAAQQGFASILVAEGAAPERIHRVVAEWRRQMPAADEQGT